MSERYRAVQIFEHEHERPVDLGLLRKHALATTLDAHRVRHRLEVGSQLVAIDSEAHA